MGRYLHRRVYKKTASDGNHIPVSQTEMRDIDVSPRISLNEMIGNMRDILNRDESLDSISRKKIANYISKIEAVLANKEERTEKNDTVE